MSAEGGLKVDEEATVTNGLYIFDIEMRDGKRGQARGVVDGMALVGKTTVTFTARLTLKDAM